MRLPLAVITICLLLPAAASASTVEIREIQGRGTYSVASYEAAPGEVNDLTVQAVAGSVVLNDPGAEITPGAGCTAIGPHSATCTTEQGLSSAYAELGDEADHFISEGPSFTVEGGAGNDVLEGGTAGGRFAGDGGDDTLRGGLYASDFSGGQGADQMTGTADNDRFMGGPGPDSIDGRGEFRADWSWGDTVSYADHKAPVTIDLSRPASPAGEAGEGDSVLNVESADGGQGPDRIKVRQDLGTELTIIGFGNGGDDLVLGSPGPDVLGGGRGHDWVRGLGGDDIVTGQQGRDTLDGGGGSNEIGSWDGDFPEQDSVTCGDAGFVQADRSTEPLLDVIDQSCGRLTFYSGPVMEILQGFTGQPVSAVDVTPRCARHCLVTIELRAHNRVVGASHREIGRERSGTLSIPLSRAAREELARRGTLKLRLSMVVRWGARLRHRDRTGYYLVLHAPSGAH